MSDTCADVGGNVTEGGPHLVGALVDVQDEQIGPQRCHHSPDRSARACALSFGDQ
ncbi:hypothetical protein [Gordonia alkanivorans]|uniref:hypothetical protein n=1 Tax=Gordonia alkanivorans TaxID=84096 RepID=UPI002447B510|nr:hypothetical protein [Gordonia alkanivorans]MDH3013945.1 hypothetical protein [Gordonia alkanivorans]